MDLNDKQVGKNKDMNASFKHAKNGIKTAFVSERNMKYHVSFGVLALILGIIFPLSVSEWLWLVGVIFIVLIVEVINTSFEYLVDLVVGESFHPIAKQVKDMAAGAVLLSAVLSLIVGGIIFIPKLIQWIR